MTRYRIATDRTRFDVSTRPGMPGLGARVSGVQGSFEITFHADGTPDLDAPLTGEFSLLVDDLQTGNQLVTAGVRAFLGGTDDAAVTGRISEVRAHEDPADDRHDVLMVVEVKGRVVKLVGTGRVVTRPAGQIEATGSTLCDPRAFGIPLPPLLNLMVHVRWRITLEPVEKFQR